MLGLHRGEKTVLCIFLRELKVSLKIMKTDPSSGSQNGKSGEVVKKMNPFPVAESDKPT